MPNLITDDQGLPKPQYEVEAGSSFESQRGKQGASFVYQKDGHNESIGATTDPETSSTLIGIAKSKKNLLTTIKETLALMKAKLDDIAGKSDTMRVSSAQITTGAIVGAVNVDVTSIELKIGGAPLVGRRTLQIFNLSETDIVYIGFSSGVTTGNGFPVWPKTSHTMNISAGSGIVAYAIAAVPAAVRIVES
jgi:hypothetical protein